MSNQKSRIGLIEDALTTSLNQLLQADVNDANFDKEVEKSAQVCKITDQMIKLSMIQLKAMEMVNSGGVGMKQVNEVFSLPEKS